MQIQIRAHAIDLTHQIRRAIDRRIRLSLGPLSGRIALSDCSLKPDDARSIPVSGAPGVHCRIEATCKDGTRIRTEARGVDCEEAAEVAAWRLQHRLRLRRDTLRMSGVG